MHRWMASAAGGTSQRLKPGGAMMRACRASQLIEHYASPCEPLLFKAFYMQARI